LPFYYSYIIANRTSARREFYTAVDVVIRASRQTSIHFVPFNLLISMAFRIRTLDNSNPDHNSDSNPSSIMID